MTPCTPGGDAPGNVASMGFLPKPHKLNLIPRHIRHIQLRATPPNTQVGKTQERHPLEETEETGVTATRETGQKKGIMGKTGEI